ncbi:NAD(P)/FAD-dependent oxidoreductase [Phyllobacterium sp. K27]
MAPKSFDVMVLGAGVIGISTALYLQQRGKKVVVIDRCEPGRETSYGNAGFIEASAVLPHPFPKGLRNLVRLALNRSNGVRTDYLFLPRILPWLLAYKTASREVGLAKIGPSFRALISASLPCYRELIANAQATDLLVEDGWLELCRTNTELQEADRVADQARGFGVRAHKIAAQELESMEPALIDRFAGAIHWQDTVRISDPGGLIQRFAKHFLSQDGFIAKGDALDLHQAGTEWHLTAGDVCFSAPHVVVALGPWSGTLAKQLGYRIPLIAKRGYHQHFENTSSPPLKHAVYVRDQQCLIVPTVQGVRVLTGVELAPFDAPPAFSQIDKMVQCAQNTVALGKQMETSPWLGARPCLPDMLPVIGPALRHPGLWFAFGHGHYGFTQGPVTGRLIADLITGERPLLPVEPYAADRFSGVHSQTGWA